MCVLDTSTALFLTTRHNKWFQSSAEARTLRLCGNTLEEPRTTHPSLLVYLGQRAIGAQARSRGGLTGTSSALL